ncbi:hypothetical protein F4779DRAFT_616945 [Xylariaceae sp. FL0662B]|nr:hypothetical protein F4779DRAFT_616945 [Xylariaceae sp. FL0662B]
MRRHGPWEIQRPAARQRVAILRPLRLIPNAAELPPDETVAGLGLLEYLPNEVIMVIFGQCTLHALLRVQRVNKIAQEMIQLLPDIAYVKDTVRGIMERAKPRFRQFMSKILRITTYNAIRQLLLSKECESCGGQGGSFRIVRVKVLCDRCFGTKKVRGR